MNRHHKQYIEVGIVLNVIFDVQEHVFIQVIRIHFPRKGACFELKRDKRREVQVKNVANYYVYFRMLLWCPCTAMFIFHILVFDEAF